MTLWSAVTAVECFNFEMEYAGSETQAGLTDFKSSDIYLPRLLWHVGPSGYVSEQTTLQIWKKAKGISGDMMKVSNEI